MATNHHICIGLHRREHDVTLLLSIVPKFLSNIVHIACKTYPGEFLAHGWGFLIITVSLTVCLMLAVLSSGID